MRILSEFPDYAVDKEGQIWRVVRPVSGPRYNDVLPYKMTCRVGSSGYTNVNLAKNGVMYTCLVHRLVLTAYWGECPAGMEAAHNDGNRQNNCLNNLRWAQHKDNMLDQKKHGTRKIGVYHGRAKLTEQDVIDIRNSKLPSRSLAKKYGMDKSTILDAKSGKTWAHLSPQSQTPSQQVTPINLPQGT